MTERRQNVRATLAIALLILGIVLANVFGRRPEPASVPRPDQTHSP